MLEPIIKNIQLYKILIFFFPFVILKMCPFDIFSFLSDTQEKLYTIKCVVAKETHLLNSVVLILCYESVHLKFWKLDFLMFSIHPLVIIKCGLSVHSLPQANMQGIQLNNMVINSKYVTVFI